MITDPYKPTAPDVDHQEESGLAAQMAAMMLGVIGTAGFAHHRGHRRAGITKNKGRKRDKARVQMARESRRRNRVR